MNRTYSLSPDATLFHADCRDAMRALPDCSIDSVVTDPPYGLQFMGKEWDKLWRDQSDADKEYVERTAGELTSRVRRLPDYSTMQRGAQMQETHLEWAREAFRVLKPGGHIAAFSASRTYHRMACAIEDAGFEIRDSLCWLYAVGFPKSHNLDKHDGFCRCETSDDSVRDVRNGGSPLSVANETQRTDVLQQFMSQQDVCGSVPSNIAKGVGSDNPGSQGASNGAHDGTAQSGVEGRGLPSGAEGQLRIDEIRSLPAGFVADGASGWVRDGAPGGHGEALPLPPDANGMRASSGPRSKKQFACEPGTMAGQPQSQDGGAWPCCGRCGKPMVTRGLGSALKPAFEPIVLARKPLSESTVAANVLRWRTGALNIDGCRVNPGEIVPGGGNGKANHGGQFAGEYRGTRPLVEAHNMGRWPANVVHDGSAEVVEAFPSSNGSGTARTLKRNGIGYGSTAEGNETALRDAGSGSAARFFYSAKASKADRAGSKHPTVKPIALMQWLARLITPPGGVVLDPFAGSGTTGAACAAEGFRCILVEREAEYVADICRRFCVDNKRSA